MYEIRSRLTTRWLPVSASTGERLMRDYYPSRIPERLLMALRRREGVAAGHLRIRETT